MQKMRQGNYLQTSFLFYKIAYFQVEESGVQLSFNIFR